VRDADAQREAELRLAQHAEEVGGAPRCGIGDDDARADDRIEHEGAGSDAAEHVVERAQGVRNLGATEQSLSP
jgi:hypothetical protein